MARHGDAKATVTTDTFPCLSVRQPWADLIVDGVKDVENRTWPTTFRGTFLIHAGRTVERGDVGRVRRDLGLSPGQEYRPVTGAILGMVCLVDCVTSHRSRFFSGPQGFVLMDAVRFERPIPYRGRLGFFPVPVDTIRDTPAATAEPGGTR